MNMYTCTTRQNKKKKEKKENERVIPDYTASCRNMMQINTDK